VGQIPLGYRASEPLTTGHRQLIYGKYTYGYQDDWVKSRPKEKKLKIPFTPISQEQIKEGYYTLKEPEELE